MKKWTDLGLTGGVFRQSLLDKAYLYMAVFCQTWHSPYYRKRYIDGLKLTNEEGSFPVYNFETGKLEYITHHYSEKELVSCQSSSVG